MGASLWLGHYLRLRKSVKVTHARTLSHYYWLKSDQERPKKKANPWCLEAAKVLHLRQTIYMAVVFTRRTWLTNKARAFAHSPLLMADITPRISFSYSIIKSKSLAAICCWRGVFGQENPPSALPLLIIFVTSAANLAKAQILGKARQYNSLDWIAYIRKQDPALIPLYKIPC